jgi:outer membrane protein assembly factor BamA
MQKPAAVLGFLLFVLPLIAQPDSPVRPVHINDLVMTGVSHVSTTDLQAIRDELQLRCCAYAETQEIRECILYAFQERGYFQSRINQFDVTSLDMHIVPPAVAVSVEVNEGQQFKLKSIAFSGAKAFSSGQLRQQFAISDGDIFNTETIRVGLDSLRKLYASQGFINFTPVPNTDADDASSTVSLAIDLDEGQQFRLGRLLLDGEEPDAGDGAKLIEAWKSMEGKIYDGRKMEQWWQLASSMLPPGARLEESLELKQDPASGIVTALLKFPTAK